MVFPILKIVTTNWIDLFRNPRDSVDGIIANDMLSESAYVTVREGEYFKIIGAKGQKVY
jgi:hypothetical protein